MGVKTCMRASWLPTDRDGLPQLRGERIERRAGVVEHWASDISRSVPSQKETRANPRVLTCSYTFCTVKQTEYYSTYSISTSAVYSDERMETIYLAERTWGKPYHLLRPSFITSKPKSRPIIPPVDTNLASYTRRRAQLPYDSSPETAGPNTPDDTFTSYPSATTAATTPASSPLRGPEAKLCVGVQETVCSSVQLEDDEPGPEEKMLEILYKYVEAGMRRYMEETMHGKGEKIAVGEHF